MSRKTTRKRRLRRKTRRRQEIVGVIVLLTGIALLLSLVSYSPTDPPAFDSSGGDPRNWIGLVGANLAHIMVQKLGRLPPLLTISLVLLWGWKLLRDSVDRGLIVLSLKVIGIHVLLSILLAFPHFLIRESISYDLAGEWGGWIAGSLVSYVGVVGAPIVWIALLMLFLMSAFGWKPGEIAGTVSGGVRTTTGVMGKIAAALWSVAVWIAGTIKSVVSGLKRRLSKRWAVPPEGGETPYVAPPVTGDDTGQVPVSESPVVVVAEDVEEGDWVEPVEVGVEVEEDEPGPARPRPTPPPRMMDSTYDPPPLDLFAPSSDDEIGPDEAEVRKEAELLQEKLLSFGVQAEVTRWVTGPVITRFEIRPAPGVKVNLKNRDGPSVTKR